MLAEQHDVKEVKGFGGTVLISAFSVFFVASVVKWFRHFYYDGADTENTENALRQSQITTLLVCVQGRMTVPLPFLQNRRAAV